MDANAVNSETHTDYIVSITFLPFLGLLVAAAIDLYVSKRWGKLSGQRLAFAGLILTAVTGFLPRLFAQFIPVEWWVRIGEALLIGLFKWLLLKWGFRTQAGLRGYVVLSLSALIYLYFRSGLVPQ